MKQLKKVINKIGQKIEEFDLKIGTYVFIPGIDERGVIDRAYKDDHGKAVYGIQLDNKYATPTGYFLARRHELEIEDS